MAERFRLSDKYIDFIGTDAKAEFLEGTTYSGKTTTAVFKFMLEVNKSSKRAHIISGLDLGTVEKNIINHDLGIMDIFGDMQRNPSGRCIYNSNGRGSESLPHLIFFDDHGIKKVIYILGYGDKARWKKALGGQYGCLYIDEINVADIDYVREAVMRCDYLLATLNPDDPSLPVYDEYINHSRPKEKYLSSIPTSIREALMKQEPKDQWIYWFFSFDDNPALTAEKRQQIIENVPKGTKLWKNKIEGLRGRATGLVFSNFSDRNIIRLQDLFTVNSRGEKVQRNKWQTFSVGVDTAYSCQSADTIAIIFVGITQATDKESSKAIILDEEVYNNTNLINPIAPSDTIGRVVDFAERNRDQWGFARNIFLDSADQATITEWIKYKREHGSIYELVGAWKKTKNIDRIHLQLGWLQSGDYLVLDHCKNHIHELEAYSWKSDKYEPEDGNDHTINASQYAWLPFKELIGRGTQK